MQITLYLDVIFLVNFVVDFMALELTAFVLKLQSPWWRIFLAAGVGGVSGLTLLCIPGSLSGVAGVTGLVGSSIGANMIAFGRKGVIQKWFCSTTILFLLGGVMSYVKGITGKTTLSLVTWFVLLVEGLGIVGLLVHITKKRHLAVPNLSFVVMNHEGKHIHFQAFVDTGNFLWDPLLGKPVVLISREVMEGLVNDTEKEMISKYLKCGYIDYSQMLYKDVQRKNCFHEIAYQSVGQPCGKLICFLVEEMIVGNSDITERKQPVAVAPDYLFCGQEYQGLIGGCYGEYSQQ
jgi:stage II sporulation protein GA (sporulation sigma-E factor processing peptidase)